MASSKASDRLRPSAARVDLTTLWTLPDFQIIGHELHLAERKMRKPPQLSTPPDKLPNEASEKTTNLQTEKGPRSGNTSSDFSLLSLVTIFLTLFKSSILAHNDYVFNLKVDKN